ncbi:MAG: nucleotide sugar dehydrogenase [Candidatus Lokiarchaeota archaeon]|nr:nucleotide sugar dehydrogenase [Candidatus Lokiarchaeota archaeon]MBD3200361.1 nucleotide sugar dehydrogenase [Candidatus Lokiarchaeota archaeon]
MLNNEEKRKISLKNYEDWQKAIDKKDLRIAVIGIGRIGLPTSLVISKRGFMTYGIDINPVLVEKVNQGGGDPPIPFVLDEPNLAETLKDVVLKGLFKATTQFEQFAKISDVILICVPTPVTEHKVPDYSIIDNVVKDIGSLKDDLKNKIIIFEPTLGPHYVEKHGIPSIESFSGLKVNRDFWVVSCPERANPGYIMENLTSVPRIVGGSNDFAGKVITSLYKKVYNVEIIQVSNPRTANSIKLIENIFRTVNIAFANEISQLMRRLDIDYMEVLKGAATKYNFLPHYPGPGVGGPCLPSNPYYLIDDGYKVSFTPNLVRLATEINQRQPAHITELIFEGLNKIGYPIAGTPIAFLGISYKANVKDIQISSAIPIIEDLRNYNASVKVYDPFYKSDRFLNMKIAPDYKFIQQDYPIIVVHTDHKEFCTNEFKQYLKKCSNLKVLVDCHNIYEYQELPQGIYYIGVGRPAKYIE